MRTFIAVAIILVSLLCISNSQCFGDNKVEAFIQYRKAWDYFESEDIENARKLVDKNYVSDDGKLKAYWLILKASIEIHERAYENALKTIRPFRNILKEKYYNSIKQPDLVSKFDKKFIVWNYRKLLNISSMANFELKNWLDAINDYIELTKEFKDNQYGFKAFCYYELKNYPESLINFQFAYKKAESLEVKDELAFNIGCIYAILGEVDQAISWLQIPLSHNNELWTNKVYQEKDFDNIRDNYKFKKFLKSFVQKKPSDPTESTD